MAQKVALRGPQCRFSSKTSGKAEWGRPVSTAPPNPVRHRHTLTATLSRQGEGEVLARLRLGARNDIRALLGNQ